MERTSGEARQIFLEQYGGALVAANHLRTALVFVSLSLLVALGSMVWVLVWARNQKPLIVRIDEVGRATALDYKSFEYKAEERELRYFLAQFVHLYFGRMVSSVEERFGKSLYFVDSSLSQVLIDEERKGKLISKFLKEGGDEIDIAIKNIALLDLSGTPKKATVDFEKVYLSRVDHHEVRRERYAGYFEFVVQSEIPNTFVLVNPLGLTITYFRTDAAFKE